MTYEQQLQTPQWKAKRLEIIDRDMGMCQHCMTSKNLQVHHKYYEGGKMAWDYPNIALITLCNSCHENTHRFNGRPGPMTDLDRALARLVAVAGGVRDWCDKQYPEDMKDLYTPNSNGETIY